MKSILKQLSFVGFRMGQRLGFNICPNHYYVPLADVNYLRKTRNAWVKPSEMTGIDCDIDAQIHNIEKMITQYK